MERARVGFALERGQGEDRDSKTVAKGNDDDTEMDCLAIANGKLDLCLQSPGGQPFAKAKMKSVNTVGPLSGVHPASALAMQMA